MIPRGYLDRNFKVKNVSVVKPRAFHTLRAISVVAVTLILLLGLVGCASKKTAGNAAAASTDDLTPLWQNAGAGASGAFAGEALAVSAGETEL
jgi:hypothetical protein